jgi:hypothetical protein
MTTATIDFNQPTLFKEGRFTRDTPAPAAPHPERAAPPAAPSEHRSAPSEHRSAPSEHRSTPPAPPTGRSAAEPHPKTPLEGHAAHRPATLDDVVSAAWEGLIGHHSVTCPVCSGSMAPRYGSGAAPVGGRCKRCGSTLG